MQMMWSCLTGGGSWGNNSHQPLPGSQHWHLGLEMLLWTLSCAQSLNPRVSERKFFRRSWELVGILTWETLTKGDVLKLFFVYDRAHTCCHHLECHVTGKAGLEDSSWKSDWGGWQLLHQRTTTLLVWAMNSSELRKWHIVGSNFAGWRCCQGYSASQNHRISKCVLKAKINMPFSFSWSMTGNPVNQQVSFCPF